jgi:hypothetical protein
MAKMIPTLEDQEIIAAHDSSAELQVYRALEISLSDEYTVFYSVRWLARGRKGQHRDGETDFVVIHPDQGFLVIEVKGGSLERDAGSDRWVNTSNGARAEIESPFAQAENSKRALIGKIQSLPGWEKRRFTIGHSVFLPNIRKAQAYLGADAPA